MRAHNRRPLLQVWLGRFQETDVAIKKLNSLGQLAMGMAQEDSAVAQAPGAGVDAGGKEGERVPDGFVGCL